MKHKNITADRFLNLNPFPSWIYNVETFRVMDVNDAAIQLFGYTRTEFLNLNLNQLRLPSDGSMSSSSALAEEIKVENTHLEVSVYKKKSGQTLRMEVNSHEVDYQDCQCVLAVGQDVTEKEIQVELLTASERKLKAVSAIAKIGYWSLELDANKLTWTDEVYNIWGRKREDFDLNYQNFVKTIHSSDMEVFNKNQDLAFKGFNDLDHIYRIILPNNDVRWVHELGRLIKDTKGNPIAFEGTTQDVTKKINEEQHLKLLTSVVTNTNDAVLITKAEPDFQQDATITYVNEAFTKMTGYAPEELMGKSPRILEGPNSNREKIDKFRRALRNWEKHDITILNYKKNGKEFWNHISFSPIADEKGNFTHWVAIQRDVTKQKTKEFENALLSQISHNFSSAKNFKTATKELCKSILNFGNFEVVELWLTDLENKNLQLNSFFTNIENDKIDTIAYSAYKFQQSQGFIGKVWHEKKQLLCKDLLDDPNFIRKKQAQQMGLSSICGVPLLFQKEVIGVLAIGTKLKSDHITDHSGFFKKLETFIGSEINRKKLEHDLKYLYDSVPDIICITDLEGRILKINNAVRNIIGLKPKEIIYRRFVEFVHPDDQKKFSHSIKRSKLHKAISDLDIRIITENGETIWLNWTCNPTVEKNLLHVIAKDITKEKRPLELSREASKLAKIGSWEFDFVKNRMHWSKVIHDLYGSDSETFTPDLEMSRHSFRSDFQGMVTSEVEICINNCEPFDFEAVLITAKNQEKWVRVIGDADIKDGKCRRIYGSLQDIDDLKEAELRLQSFADNLPGVVFKFTIYPNGKEELSQITKEAEQVWGFKAEEIIKNNQLVWNQIENAGDLENFNDSITESMANKTKWSARWNYVMPNGELKTHVGYGTPLFLADGTVEFNAMILDITQEAKNEELLKEATEMAKIGSWKIDLDYENEHNIYWSPMIKDILEVDQDYDPSPSGGFEFYTEESKIEMQNALQKLINTGKEFDLELLFNTAKGRQKWVRCIGKKVVLQGEYSKLRGIVQDITTSKLYELQVVEILESISDAFYAVDKHWNITYFNKEAERLLNIKSSEVLGKNLWSVFPDVLNTPLEDFYKRVVKYNKSQSFDYFYTTENIWHEVNAYASNGGLSVYFKNIDSRIKAARQLKDAFEEKNNILESIDDAFITVNKSWIITYWNRQAEVLFEFSKSQVIGLQLWDVFPEVVGLESYDLYQTAMDKATTISFEEYYPKSNKWFGSSVYPSEQGLSIYSKDITLKKEGDQRLILANERFEKVAEATNDAIWDWDIVENTQYWGGGFQKLFGYHINKNDATLNAWIEHVHPDDRERITKSLEYVLYNTKLNNWVEEFRFQKKDGSYSNVLNKGLILRNANTTPVRMVGAITDVTQVKAHEAELTTLNKSLKNYALELERSNEELEQFAYISSHDLQEPLRMISSFMDLLKKKYGDQLDDKALAYIHYASDGAKRMKQIILDLLQYSKAMRPTDDIEDVSMDNLLSEYKLLRRKIISKKKVTIKSDKLPITRNYRAALINILHNLLDNAINYSKDDVAPIIEIKAREEENFWVYSVSDNGIGIDDQFFDKIFVMFQRLHNRDQYDGTGIGLSIAKRNIEFLGGKIWLESVPGEGSTFYFTLPKNK